MFKCKNKKNKKNIQNQMIRLGTGHCCFELCHLTQNKELKASKYLKMGTINSYCQRSRNGFFICNKGPLSQTPVLCKKLGFFPTPAFSCSTKSKKIIPLLA